MKKLTKYEKEFAKNYGINQRTFLSIKNYFNDYFEKTDNKWIDCFKSNPYKCMNIDGFGFKRCDNIAEKIGFDMNSPLRIKAYVCYCVDRNSNGDTILEIFKIIDSMAKELNITDRNKIISVIFENDGEYILLDDKCRVVTKARQDNGILPIYITLREWYESEKFIFEWCKSLKKSPRVNKKQDVINSILEGSGLNEEQSYAVEHILDENFNLLIGASGTGKTYTTNKVIQVLEKHNQSYTLLAPTGIASFNLSEKTNRECKTIHRKFYLDKKIYTDYVIIDEFGMCSCSHIMLLKEMLCDKASTKVIFIGDKYQLPSISAGDFLSSIMKLIQNGRLEGNVFELTKIMRSTESSYIPHLCNMFTGNNRFNPSVMNDNALKGVTFYDREYDLFEQIDKIIKINKWKLEETAIIMPQRKGEYGCDAFNEYMQNKNKSKVFYHDKFRTFKENDVLMHIKNNTELNIYNGELIEIVGKNGANYVVRRLYDGSEIEYDEETLKEQVSLSYSNTVHKVQGCTVKNVIFIAIQEHSYMLSRNLAYVGMSRASDNLIVICDRDVVVKTSFKNLTDKRKTFLNLLCS